MKQYLCRVQGLDDDGFVQYEAENHVNAASDYAQDVARSIQEQHPGAYVKDITVETYDLEAEEMWRIEIEMIHIRQL